MTILVSGCAVRNPAIWRTNKKPYQGRNTKNDRGAEHRTLVMPATAITVSIESTVFTIVI